MTTTPPPTAVTRIPTRAPEVNGGVTTSWFPMTTAYPFIPGCDKLWWKVVPDILAGWDPGYGLFVNSGVVACHPPEVTSWWDAEHLGVDVLATQRSLGPVICPSAYTTARTSVNEQQSTLVGCCPSGYTFVDFNPAGRTDQCVSGLSAGEVVQFATYVSSSWKTTTSTVPAASFIHGIHVNGWLFPDTTASTSSAMTTPAPAETTPASPGNGGESNGLSDGAKIGIGVGVSLGVVAIALAIWLVWFFKRRAAKQAQNEAGMTSGWGANGGQYGWDPNAMANKTTPSVTPYEMHSPPTVVEVPGQYPFHEVAGSERPVELMGSSLPR